MKYITFLFLGTGILIFSGCSTTNVEQVPGSMAHSKYAPVNSQEQYGVVSYLDKGFSSAARREDAYKKMYEVCNGKYKIIRESSKNIGATYNAYQYNKYSSGTATNISRRYIQYTCVK